MRKSASICLAAFWTVFAAVQIGLAIHFHSIGFAAFALGAVAMISFNHRRIVS